MGHVMDISAASVKFDLLFLVPDTHDLDSLDSLFT